jgi:hypothetical protein
MISIRFTDESVATVELVEGSHFDYVSKLWKKAYDTQTTFEAEGGVSEFVPVHRVPKALAAYPQMSSGSDSKLSVELPCIRVTTSAFRGGDVESEWIIIEGLTPEVEAELIEELYYGTA